MGELFVGFGDQVCLSCTFTFILIADVSNGSPSESMIWMDPKNRRLNGQRWSFDMKDLQLRIFLLGGCLTRLGCIDFLFIGYFCQQDENSVVDMA